MNDEINRCVTGGNAEYMMQPHYLSDKRMQSFHYTVRVTDSSLQKLLLHVDVGKPWHKSKTVSIFNKI